MDDDCNLKIDVDEDLGNYWKCLSGIDQKRWFAKEVHLRRCLKIRTLDDYNLSLLSHSVRGHKMISNLCNYDILSNDRYADAFFYTKMECRAQQFQFESSDIVAKILYLGEERIVDIHNQRLNTNDSNSDQQESVKHSSSSDSDDEAEDILEINTSAGMMKQFRNAKKRENGVNELGAKDKLLTKLRGTLGDIGEDFDVDFGDIGMD